MTPKDQEKLGSRWVASGRILPALGAAMLTREELRIFHFSILVENSSRDLNAAYMSFTDIIVLYSHAPLYKSTQRSEGITPQHSSLVPLEAPVIKKHLGFACWL